MRHQLTTSLLVRIMPNSVPRARYFKYFINKKLKEQRVKQPGHEQTAREEAHTIVNHKRVVQRGSNSGSISISTNTNQYSCSPSHQTADFNNGQQKCDFGHFTAAYSATHYVTLSSETANHTRLHLNILFLSLALSNWSRVAQCRCHGSLIGPPLVRPNRQTDRQCSLRAYYARARTHTHLELASSNWAAQVCQRLAPIDSGRQLVSLYIYLLNFLARSLSKRKRRIRRGEFSGRRAQKQGLGDKMAPELEGQTARLCLPASGARASRQLPLMTTNVVI